MKIHPLLRIAVTKPDILASHAAAYGALVEEEMRKVATSWISKIVLFAAAGLMALFGLGWGGVALMLWGTLPASQYPFGWILWAVPLAAFAIAAVLALTARAKPVEQAMTAIKAQIGADLALLNEAGRE